MTLHLSGCVPSDLYNAFTLSNGSCIECNFNQYPSGDGLTCTFYNSLWDKAAGDVAMKDSINAGNTGYMIMCCALVMFMLPGLALYYGALTPDGSVINTVLLSMTSMCLISVVWILLGYSLSFGPGGEAWGTAEWGAFANIGTLPSAIYGDGIPHIVFALFQNMFAQITPALLSGAVAGRMTFLSYCIFIVLWSLLVYCPLARWVWSFKIDEESGEAVANGFLGKLGVMDFAGGCVIHISAGFGAAAASFVMGPRLVRPEVKVDVTKLLSGLGLLWFGWFGFNAGSALSANATAAGAAVATHFATCASVVTWLVLEYSHQRVISFPGMCSAAVIGLVAVTPACGFVSPAASLAVGSIAALFCYCFHQLKINTRLDSWCDDADVWRDHGMAGFIGVFLTGVFANENINGGGGAAGGVNGYGLAIGHQLGGAMCCAVYSFGVTGLLMLLLKYTIGIRVEEDQELFGLDRNHDSEDSTKDNTRAPTDEEEPFAVIFTDIQSSSKLWSKSHSLMAKAIDKHNKAIRRIIDKYECYEVKIIGDAFMITSKSISKAVRFAADLQVELDKEDWDDEGKLNTYYQRWELASQRKGSTVGAGGSTAFGQTSTTDTNNNFIVTHKSTPSEVDEAHRAMSQQGGQQSLGSASTPSSQSDPQHPQANAFSNNNSMATNNNNTNNSTPQMKSSTSMPLTRENTMPLGIGTSTQASSDVRSNSSVSQMNSMLSVNGLRVRVGVHYGHGAIIWNQVAHSYDFLGTVVNCAARIEALGTGGQTLVSKAAFDAAVQEDPKIQKDYLFLNMGSHSLRGIRGETKIFQVSHPLLKSRRLGTTLRVNIAERETDDLGRRKRSLADLTQEDAERSQGGESSETGGGGPRSGRSGRSGRRQSALFNGTTLSREADSDLDEQQGQQQPTRIGRGNIYSVGSGGYAQPLSTHQRFGSSDNNIAVPPNALNAAGTSSSSEVAVGNDHQLFMLQQQRQLAQRNNMAHGSDRSTTGSSSGAHNNNIVTGGGSISQRNNNLYVESVGSSGSQQRPFTPQNHGSTSAQLNLGGGVTQQPQQQLNSGGNVTGGTTTTTTTSSSGNNNQVQPRSPQRSTGYQSPNYIATTPSENGPDNH